MSPPANHVGDQGEVMARIRFHPPDWRSPGLEPLMISSMQWVTAMHGTLILLFHVRMHTYCAGLGDHDVTCPTSDGSMPGPAKQILAISSNSVAYTSYMHMLLCYLCQNDLLTDIISCICS